jgi:hypothetical protein
VKAIRRAFVLAGLLIAQLAFGAEYSATPADYLRALPGLKPGDTLRLAAGHYARGLPIRALQGEPGRPIVITGPNSGEPAVLVAVPGANTVSIRNSSHVAIRNLRLEGRGLQVDGVRAEADSRFAHHITVENLVIVGYGHDQQNVAISTQCPAWGWIIRGNVVVGAGTGMYLGGSDGGVPFVGGLIEHNVIVDTIGYNLQIKHQKERPPGIGMPPGPVRTIIRHNVFSKANGAAGGKFARPNLLVGHFPRSGPGADDEYAIYGNFFYQNPTEVLFQGEGNVAFYDNVLVNTAGSAVAIQPHNDRPKRIRVFHNTIVARDSGVHFQGADDAFRQFVARNAIFAAQPLVGRDDGGNLVGSQESAPRYLVAPGGAPGAGLELSWRPGAGRVPAPALDVADLPDSGFDFEGRSRAGGDVGAYAAGAERPAWPLQLDRKPGVLAVRAGADARLKGRATAQ